MNKVPCFVKEGSRWVKQEKDCLQLDEDNARKLSERQVEYSYMKARVELLQKENDQLRALSATWKDREGLWEQRLKIKDGLLEEEKKRVLLWKDSFDKAQKKSVPWYAHPFFVATTTAVVTGSVIFLTLHLSRR